MAIAQPPRHPDTTTPLLPDGERSELPDPVAASAQAAGVAPTWTHADILAQLRENASALDPSHDRLYHNMSLERWAAAGELGVRLLLEHEGYWRQRRRDGRGGRRAHASAIYGLLAASNGAELIAAASCAALVFRLVPPGPANRARATERTAPSDPPPGPP